MSVLVSFLVSVIKHPDKSNLWNKGFIMAHCSGYSPVWHGRGVVEREEGAHMASTVRREMDAGAQPTFSLLGLDLPTLINRI